MFFLRDRGLFDLGLERREIGDRQLQIGVGGLIILFRALLARQGDGLALQQQPVVGDRRLPSRCGLGAHLVQRRRGRAQGVLLARRIDHRNQLARAHVITEGDLQRLDLTRRPGRRHRPAKRLQ